MAVYELKLKNNLVYKKFPQSRVNYLEQDVVAKIIEAWTAYKNGTIFNSTNIRLEDVCIANEQVLLTIGYTCFYDFLISNIIKQQFDEFKEYIIQSDVNDGKEIISELENYYLSIKDEYDDFCDLITKGNMANAIAVSVLVMDKNDNIMLVKRSNKVAIGKDLYSVTATGATDDEDFENDNPIKHCALRELTEELNLELDINDFHVKAIVAGKKKQQPIAIVDAIVDFNLDDIKLDSATAKDFELEIDKVFICKRDDIKGILNKQSFTEAAEYHLSTLIG